MENKTLKVAELFAGVGGFRLGLEKSNYKVICKIVSKGNPGRTMGLNDMDTGIRISESYALAGKKLGAYIAKAIGK